MKIYRYSVWEFTSTLWDLEYLIWASWVAILILLQLWSNWRLMKPHWKVTLALVVQSSKELVMRDQLKIHLLFMNSSCTIYCHTLNSSYNNWRAPVKKGIKTLYEKNMHWFLRKYLPYVQLSRKCCNTVVIVLDNWIGEKYALA